MAEKLLVPVYPSHWLLHSVVDEFFRLRALSFPLHRVDDTAHWFQKS